MFIFFSSSIFQLFLENTFWFIFQKLFDTPPPLSLIHFPFQGLETGCNNRKYLAIPLPPLQNLFLIKNNNKKKKNRNKQTKERKRKKQTITSRTRTTTSATTTITTKKEKVQLVSRLHYENKINK